jgi:uncharacterized protein (TIGR03118 family)
VIVAIVPALYAGPVGFVVHNLVSNQPGIADFQDTNLVNPWGLASSSSGPFWIANEETGTSTVYNSAGMPNSAILVTIPGEGSVTGITFTGSGGFNDNLFLFASEDGTVSGWRPALGQMTTAETLVPADPDNEYKGLTYASTGGFPYAYLANFEAGTIDVLKGDALAPDLAGSFLDPGLPAEYTPFNVQVLNGIVYVAYAVKGMDEEEPGPGNGIVDTYDLNGNFIQRLVTGGALNAPWGLAIAPAGFLDLGGALLVGNFGDGRINAYDPLTGTFIRALADTSGTPISIDGLWALRFGNGGNGGLSGVLYFTAGPDDETNGLFGSIAAVPEPGFSILIGCASLLMIRKKLLKRASTSR